MLLYIPHILYGIKIYANTKPSYLDKLNKLNNKLRILRILQNKPITSPLCELYKSYNTLSIPNLHKYQLLFVHKFINHPELLLDVFIHSNFLLLMKKFTVIIRELKIIYTFTTHLQHQALDQLNIKLLFYGMTCHRSLQQIESLLVFKNHLRCYLLSSV